MTRSFVHLLAATAAALAASCAWAQAPVKVGIVTFLSGPRRVRSGSRRGMRPRSWRRR